MEGRISTFCHVLPSWKVYPTTDYFRRRFMCVMERLPRVIEHLPTGCQGHTVLSRLRNFNDLLERKPRIIVVGKENIDLHQIVVDPQYVKTVSEELSKEEGITTVVCHIDIYSVEHDEMKEVKAAITYACTECASANTHDNLFVVCDLHGDYTDQQLEDLHGLLFEQLQSQLKDFKHSERIIFGSGSGLHVKINEFFENLIIENMIVLGDDMQRFDLRTKTSKNLQRNETRCLDLEIVSEAIRDLLKNPLAEYKGTILKKVVKTVRCAIIQPFEDYYDIPSWICNAILHETDFENNLLKSISRNEEYHVKKLEETIDSTFCTYQGNWRKTRRYLFSSYRLLQDMSSTVLRAGENISAIRMTLKNTGKINKEINGYLRQATCYHQSSGVRLNENVKRRFSEVDGIYFENGSKIWKSNSVHFGTLGSFVSSGSNSLFALTCAHVVQGGTHFICAQNKNGKQMRFAVTAPEMTLVSGNSSLRLVDIAAVKVYDQIRGMCDQYLKDDDGERKEAKLSHDPPVDLIGSFVYQYGATSGFKKGIVVPNDCSTFGDNANEYILNVECLAGAESKTFAEPGDSGAVICMTDIDTNTVKAVGMVHGGLMSDGSCLAFHLGKALDELAKQSGEHFHM